MSWYKTFKKTQRVTKRFLTTPSPTRTISRTSTIHTPSIIKVPRKMSLIRNQMNKQLKKKSSKTSLKTITSKTLPKTISNTQRKTNTKFLTSLGNQKRNRGLQALNQKTKKLLKIKNTFKISSNALRKSSPFIPPSERGYHQTKWIWVSSISFARIAE